MFSWTVHILVIANMMISALAIPVDHVVRPPNISPRATSTNSTTDFTQSWGPSVLLNWVDQIAYPNTNYTAQQLCQKIGTQLEPLTANGFWKDFGGSAKAVAGATPWIAEAAVKYSRGDQS